MPYDIQSAPATSPISLGQAIYLSETVNPIVTIGSSVFLRSGNFLVGEEATYPQAFSLFENFMAPYAPLGTGSPNNSAFSLVPVINSCSFFSGRWWLCGNYSTYGFVLSSSDGITWREDYRSPSFTPNRIVWHNGVYIIHMTVRSNNNQGLYTTTDFQTVTLRTSRFSDLNYLPSDAYSDGSIVMFSGTNGTIVTSPDGISWTTRTLPGSSASQNVNSIAKGPQGWVASNRLALYSSPDGFTWTARTMPPGFTSAPFGSFCSYENGYYMLTANTLIWRTADMTSWTEAGYTISTTSSGKVRWCSNRRWVCPMVNGNVATSQNGTTWTVVYSSIATGQTIDITTNGLDFMMGGPATPFVRFSKKTIGIVDRTVTPNGLLYMRIK